MNISVLWSNFFWWDERIFKCNWCFELQMELLHAQFMSVLEVFGFELFADVITNRGVELAS